MSRCWTVQELEQIVRNGSQSEDEKWVVSATRHFATRTKNKYRTWLIQGTNLNTILDEVRPSTLSILKELISEEYPELKRELDLILLFK